MEKVNNSTQQDMDTGQGKGLLDDAKYMLMELIVSLGLCGSFSVLGVITNILNMAVLVKQGLTDSVTINLFSLAIADFCVCMTTVLWALLVLLRIYYPALDDGLLSVQYIASGWPHNMFSRMSSAITVLVSLERCLAVALPFKVKNFFSPRRMVVSVSAMCLLMAACYMPIFSTRGLSWQWDSETNKTKLLLWFADNRILMEKFNDIFNSIFLPFIYLLTVIVCTQIMVYGIKSSSNFRKKTKAAVTGDKDMKENVTIKDKKVVKMVSAVCLIFIVFNIPELVLICAKMLEPRLNMDKQYQNLFMSLFSIDFLLDSINASINIFVYYKMSTRYCLAFRALFCSKPT